MNTEKTLMKYGFVNDIKNSKLKEVLKDNVKLKEIHIDIYPENPLDSPTLFMLLLRTYEKNVIVSNDDNRIILKKNDRDKTYLMNILFSKIIECSYRILDGYSEFILNIQNIYYRITIFN